MATLGGKCLVEHVRDRLVPQVSAVVACGRSILNLEGLADRPGPGLGPLGGLNAALKAAADRGFDAVLSVPCDTPYIPCDLRDRLSVAETAFVTEVPVIGLWPAKLATLLDRRLAEGGKQSMRGWAECAAAVPISLPTGIVNVNRQADLETLRAGHG
jgi:molybdenum cofactor guanylyltransferase